VIQEILSSSGTMILGPMRSSRIWGPMPPGRNTRRCKRQGYVFMSGPIVRRYGFPNFEKIFGERPIEHGAEEPESAESRPDEKDPAGSKPKPSSPKGDGSRPGESKGS
jgi:hypothetical protein